MGDESTQENLPEVAFYYPGWIWGSSDRLKNLLLFFDGVALLIPEYMEGREELVEPETATPLLDRGLLHIMEPETFVDKEATEQLAEVLTNIITSGVLDPLAEKETRFHELSYSRLGAYGDIGLAKMILDELKERGLARGTEDGVSIPMHPMVHSLILVLLSQILRPYGSKLGLNLAPTTDRPALVDALREVLSLPSVPSAGRIVSTDLETVSVDLTHVPLDEVLGFRDEHRADYRAYAQAVKRFVRELSLLPPTERDDLIEARRQEIEEMAQALKRQSRKAWRRDASFGLGIAGAAWSAGSGDPIGLIIGAGGLLAGLRSTETQEYGAYSYVFRAAQQYT